jgi:hypothetical protein
MNSLLLPLYLIAGLCTFVGLVWGLMTYLTPSDPKLKYSDAATWIMVAVAALTIAFLAGLMPHP